MPAELIAVGTTDANSADVTVAAGAPVSVFLKGTAGAYVDPQARCVVEAKTAAGAYQLVGELVGQQRGLVIDAPGIYRIRKFAGPSFGVEQG